jgi:hypothetical protein
MWQEQGIMWALPLTPQCFPPCHCLSPAGEYVDALAPFLSQGVEACCCLGMLTPHCVPLLPSFPSASAGEYVEALGPFLSHQGVEACCVLLTAWRHNGLLCNEALQVSRRAAVLVPFWGVFWGLSEGRAAAADSAL